MPRFFIFSLKRSPALLPKNAALSCLPRYLSAVMASSISSVKGYKIIPPEKEKECLLQFPQRLSSSRRMPRPHCLQQGSSIKTSFSLQIGHKSFSSSKISSQRMHLLGKSAFRIPSFHSSFIPIPSSPLFVHKDRNSAFVPSHCATWLETQGDLPRGKHMTLLSSPPYREDFLS